MHVAINKSRRVNKTGVEVIYDSALIRRTYRQDGKAKHGTLSTDLGVVSADELYAANTTPMT